MYTFKIFKLQLTFKILGSEQDDINLKIWNKKHQQVIMEVLDIEEV